MGKIVLLLVILLLPGFFVCTENSSPVASEEQHSKTVVVSAFLYANEPVYDIRLTTSLPLGTEETSAPPINNAQVSLLKDGERYTLQASPGDSGYYHYSGDDLTIDSGDKFTLEVSYNDIVITGETTIPEPPQSVSISNDTIFIPDFSNFGPWTGGINIDTSKVRLIVSWNVDGSSLFFTTLENADENAETIETGFRFMRGRRIISQPTTRGDYTISFMNVNEYGRHCARIYRVNQEYADLYGSRSQSSQDLNEPLTNIENGLGVFSAFNSDSVFFYVK